jgi:5-methylcytosine-specific restriction endonuclease McrA
VLRAWRGERGNWCPVYRRPAHPATDLTVDHVVPLAAGGAPFDIGNTAVLCRSCNSTKGASTEPTYLGRMGYGLHPSVEAEARGWAAATTGEFRVEVRKTGRGESVRVQDIGDT